MTDERERDGRDEHEGNDGAVDDPSSLSTLALRDAALACGGGPTLGGAGGGPRDGLTLRGVRGTTLGHGAGPRGGGSGANVRVVIRSMMPRHGTGHGCHLVRLVRVSSCRDVTPGHGGLNACRDNEIVHARLFTPFPRDKGVQKATIF